MAAFFDYGMKSICAMWIVLEIRSRDEAAKSSKKWFPLVKGGPFRRWYGNHEHVVNWHNDGHEIRNFYDGGVKLKSRPQNMAYYFRPGVTWSRVSIGAPSFRYCEDGFIFADTGPVVFSDSDDPLSLASFLNTCVVTHLLGVMSPTAHFEIGQIQTCLFVSLEHELLQSARN